MDGVWGVSAHVDSMSRTIGRDIFFFLDTVILTGVYFF